MIKLSDNYICSICDHVFYIESDVDEIEFCPYCGNVSLEYEMYLDR